MQNRQQLRGCTALALAIGLLAGSPLVHAAPPSIGGCQILPANNYWNTPVDTLPVHAMSATWIASIGGAQGVNRGLHADWGNNPNADGINEIVEYGIPFITVGAPLPSSPVSFLYDDESDPGPYPIPTSAPVEGGPASNGDRHVLAIDTVNCVLYELYRAFPNGNAWTADSGARWPLNSNASRPDRWTSADAAGLAILPGLVKWEEVQAGEINHAIRFTAPNIYGLNSSTGARQYIWPARHWSGNGTNPNNPPMGVRVRLKASFNISGFDSRTQVILRAMKKYGMVLADGGSSWYFSGVSSTNWPSIVISQLNNASLIKGGDFEVVDTLPLQIDPNSEQSVQPPSPPLNLVATPGNGQASFAFQAPADTGGKPILDYTVTCGAATATGVSSPIVVTGLVNGVATMCSATARNLVFSSPPSNVVTVTTGLPAITIGVSSVNFAATNLGATSGAQSFTVQNTGSGNLGLTTLTLGGAQPGDFARAGTCMDGTVLTPMQTCSVSFTFTPLAIGTRNAILSIAHNAQGSPGSVALSGVGRTVPDAPVAGTPIAGDGEAFLPFNPPASDGNSPVTGYVVSCNAGSITVNVAASPAALTGLTNGTTYSCTITATNAAGNSAPSATIMVTPTASPDVTFVSASSRLNHGMAGVHDLPLPVTPAVAGAGVEPRIPTTAYQVVLRFAATVTDAGFVGIGYGLNGSTAFTDFTSAPAGKEIVLTLGTSAAGKTLQIGGSGVNGSGAPYELFVGFLPGDMNATTAVSAADIAAVKAQGSVAVNAQNFRFDVNLNGTINNADIAIVKSRSGTRLP
ncbi:MAG: choice-of-anchor D domain-containing protein [Betaproteobacteria bacterium]|nr:choice-of-anchor D domain-containing protein [Betaproteobacteria bacterium]